MELRTKMLVVLGSMIGVGLLYVEKRKADHRYIKSLPDSWECGSAMAPGDGGHRKYLQRQTGSAMAGMEKVGDSAVPRQFDNESKKWFADLCKDSEKAYAEL